MNERVKEIYIGGERAGLMNSTPTARALAGKGLEGDRYANGTGSYSASKGIHDVTLVEIEGIWDFFRVSGIDLHPCLLRRNIVTEGVRLADLIGATFSIGSATFQGRPSVPAMHAPRPTRRHLRSPTRLRPFRRNLCAGAERRSD